MSLDLGAAAPLLLDVPSADRNYVCLLSILDRLGGTLLDIRSADRTYVVLLSILVAINGGGGGGGGGAGLIIRDAPTGPDLTADEPPPDDTSIVWSLTFRNGSPGIWWDPVQQSWI